MPWLSPLRLCVYLTLGVVEHVAWCPPLPLAWYVVQSAFTCVCMYMTNCTCMNSCINFVDYLCGRTGRGEGEARARFFYSTRKGSEIDPAVQQICVDTENCRRQERA